MLLQIVTTNQSKISDILYVSIYFPPGILGKETRNAVYIALMKVVTLSHFIVCRVGKCDNKVNISFVVKFAFLIREKNWTRSENFESLNHTKIFSG